MEKHKCKLCLRSFSNGRALGGHMRSHMVNLTVHPKPDEPPPPPLVQLSFETESAPSSSSSPSLSSSSSEDDDKALCYGLRENPKRSFRLVDPDFSFPVESASVILQDRESETESSKNNPTRTRSKRSCDNNNNNNQFHNHQKKMKPSNDCHHHSHKNMRESSSWVEPEPVSSISDATTEEDVAFCLMMLSRDKWKRQEEKYDEEEEDDDEEEEDNEEEDDEEERSVEDSDEFYEETKSSKTRSLVRGRYKCETCKKVFRSYQALGGHRASHKKIKAAAAICEPEIEHENSNNNAPLPVAAEKKIHECPVCFRVFASGQALGGHKRTHVTGSAASAVVRSTPSTSKIGDNNNNGNSLIDLNLPAPVDEDDEMSQLENSSAVSDAEFIKPSSQIIEAQVS